MQMLGPLSDLTGEFITGKRSPSKVLQVRYPKNSEALFFPLGPFGCLFLRANYYNIIVQLLEWQTKKVNSSWLLILYPVLNPKNATTLPFWVGTPAQAMNSLVHLPVKVETVATGAGKNRLHKNKV